VHSWASIVVKLGFKATIQIHSDKNLICSPHQHHKKLPYHRQSQHRDWLGMLATDEYKLRSMRCVSETFCSALIKSTIIQASTNATKPVFESLGFNNGFYLQSRLEEFWNIDAGIRAERVKLRHLLKPLSLTEA
jgi:hypothetical protein